MSILRGKNDIMKGESKKKDNKFYSYEECKQVMSKLDITTLVEYAIRCKNDPRLPRSPCAIYKNNGWTSAYDFFVMKSESNKRSKFYSYEECKQVVSKLGITTLAQYAMRYKTDPRLPSSPRVMYKNNGWAGAYDFFGKSKRKKKAKKRRKFYSYEKCKRVVSKLGITTLAEYSRRYKIDPRLPSEPRLVYKNNGWTSAYDFLGKKTPNYYPTYEEAKEAVRRLGIRTMGEYIFDRYKEDPHLPSNPHVVYKNIGWINSGEFLA